MTDLKPICKKNLAGKTCYAKVYDFLIKGNNDKDYKRVDVYSFEDKDVAKRELEAQGYKVIICNEELRQFNWREQSLIEREYAYNRWLDSLLSNKYK